MIDSEIIDQRLVKMRTYVRHLKSMQVKNMHEFASDATSYSASLYWLQMAVQAVIDISRHIISENQWDMPKELKDIPGILAENGILPKEFACRLSSMVGMRNVIAHQYLDLDLSRIHKAIKRNLDDFDEFAKYIVEYLESET